ncbi:MAG: TIGR00300 family protein, partial [Nocardioidaceae bacterium]
MQVTETVEITGHLMDSGLLSRVLDDIREYGGDYTLDRFDLGHDKEDTSTARMTVGAEDEESLQRLLMRIQTKGVNLVDPGEPQISEATTDGVFPDGFYS